jgi:hypothetical protein
MNMAAGLIIKPRLIVQIRVHTDPVGAPEWLPVASNTVAVLHRPRVIRPTKNPGAIARAGAQCQAMKAGVTPLWRA